MAKWFFDYRLRRAAGFTLIEVLLGAFVMLVAIGAILGALLGQQVLNEHARNLSLAIQDANRVIERIRQNNQGCNSPTTDWKAGAPAPVCTGAPVTPTSWDDWLQRCGGGKSLLPTTPELVWATCQDSAGNPPFPDCATTGVTNPIRVTVAVCWRHRGRTIGECDPNNAALVPLDGGNGPNNSPGIIESPAMLTTLVTCRG